MVVHVCSIQCAVGGNDGRECRGGVSCLWACVGMYGWDVVTGLCSIQGMVGAMMDANAEEWCPVCGHA